MMIDNSTYWQNGIKFGPDWQELNIGGDFNGFVIFKDNHNGTVFFQGVLQPKYYKNPNDIVTLFELPKGYDFDFSDKVITYQSGVQGGFSNSSKGEILTAINYLFIYGGTTLQGYVSRYQSFALDPAYNGRHDEFHGYYGLNICLTIPITKK